MRILTLAFLAALILPLPLKADTFTYSYTGPDYLFNTGAFKTTESITGSFSVNSALPDNFSGSIDPTSFAFFDGVSSIPVTTNFSTSTFDITTNKSGQITAWSIDIAGLITLSSNGSPSGTFDSVSDANGSDIADGNGSWTMTDAPSDPSPVPEPENLVLVGTGLVGVAGMLRRRFRIA